MDTTKKIATAKVSEKTLIEIGKENDKINVIDNDLVGAILKQLCLKKLFRSVILTVE